MTRLSELRSEYFGYPEHTAVVNDDIEAMDVALAAPDGDCDVKFWFGGTPLTLAIRLRRTRIIEHLIAVGANVKSFATAVAAARSNERIAAMLLKAGMDLRNGFNENEISCIFVYALGNADAGVVRAFVAAGARFAQPNPTAAKSKGPIHFAAENK